MTTDRPRIERLTIQNYRVLKDVVFNDLEPLTVLLGANGSGKSTVFDAFAFLHEAFTTNLRRAWDARHRLAEIFAALRRRVPRLERLIAKSMDDGRLLLQLKDGPFERPTLSRFTSDGTLKPFAYLTVLYDPSPAAIVGIEEPENQLHPRLLPLLAEEARAAAARSEVLVTTHSPEFANALRPRELWMLYRAADGFTRAVRASAVARLQAMQDAGGVLGDLWMEGYFDVGDPLRPTP